MTIPHCSRSKSCGLWCCTIGQVTPDISTDHSTFFMKGQDYKVLQSFEMRQPLVQRQIITSQVTWVMHLVLAWCQDFHFSQLQFPFHSIPFYLKVWLYYCGTTIQLLHTATTQAQPAGSATTADGSQSHRKQQIQNTVYNKATSWCPLHRFQVLMNYDVHHSDNHHFMLCKTYCFSVDCAYTQRVR